MPRRRWRGASTSPSTSIPFVTTDHAGIFAEYERPIGSRTKLAAGGRFDYSHSAADAAKANTDLYFAYNGTRSVAATDTGASGKLRATRQVGSGLEIARRPRDHVPRARSAGALLCAETDGQRLGRQPLAEADPEYRDSGRRELPLSPRARVGQRVARLGVGLHHGPRAAADQRRAGHHERCRPLVQNVDARLLTGEFSLTCPNSDRLYATAGGSYTRGTRDTDPAAGITSPNVAEIPPANATVGLRYDRAVVFAEAQGVFAASQDRVDTDLQEAPTPGYGVLNLRVGGQLKHLRLTLALDNVFNRLYLNHNSFRRDPYRTGARVPEPGRNLYASLAYRF